MPGLDSGTAGPRIGLLDADPELGRWLSPAEVVEARRSTNVPLLILHPGPWQPPPLAGGWSQHLGFMMLEGVIAREETLTGVTATELLGPGELLQPWNQEPDEVLLPRTVAMEVLEPARLAVLGPAFLMAIEPWPTLMTALLDRAVRGTARMATHRAICQLAPIEVRLHALFWHLAERWGHVAATDTVIVPLSLRHETLGRLAGAKRSTITLALQKLVHAGLIARRPDGSWVLSGGPPPAAPIPAETREVSRHGTPRRAPVRQRRPAPRQP